MKFSFGRFKLERIFQSQLPSAASLTMLVWRNYLVNFRRLMPVALLELLAFPLVLPSILFSTVGVTRTGQLVSQAPDQTWQILLFGGLAVLATLAANAVVRPALIAMLYTSLLNKQVRPAEALRYSRSLLWSYIPVLVALALIVSAGFALWIIPGIVAVGYFLFAEPSVILEEKNGVEAFRRSVELVRGRFWAVLWRALAVSAVYGLGAFCLSIVLVQIPISLFAPMARTLAGARLTLVPFLFIGAVISSLTLPIFLSIQVILFAELKKLKR